MKSALLLLTMILFTGSLSQGSPQTIFHQTCNVELQLTSGNASALQAFLQAIEAKDYKGVRTAPTGVKANSKAFLVIQVSPQTLGHHQVSFEITGVNRGGLFKFQYMNVYENEIGRLLPKCVLE